MLVKAQVTREEAAELKRRLERCGATVTVR
jgi:ribosomal protein L7/L12